ncbi:MAG: hypothetical protein J5883_04755 [Clostridiales bacterium]|nr:hypothetical protein [Clostridiales bacterium]
MRRLKVVSLFCSLIVFALVLVGCGNTTSMNTVSQKAEPYDGKAYIRMSELTEEGEDISKAVMDYVHVNNYDSVLSVPTYITKVDDVWFIVDCYHNRVLYTDELGKPLNQWYIMTDKVTYPHTIASDGTVYLIDDTENNRVRVYEKHEGVFINTQVIDDIGSRPHFSVYDPVSDTFYVLSSGTGELYCFRRMPDSTRVYLTEVRKVEQLSDIYVRSFTIIGGDIYFVSGVSPTGAKPQVLVCDLATLNVKKTYDVPDAFAGMVQIMPIEDAFYITVSTDITGNQDYATIIRTPTLEALSKGQYEDIYSEYFIGGGTPYNISKVDDTYFLTEHRLKDHQIWSFKVTRGKITDVKTVY